jgi:hypothetical protein
MHCAVLCCAVLYSVLYCRLWEIIKMQSFRWFYCAFRACLVSLCFTLNQSINLSFDNEREENKIGILLREERAAVPTMNQSFPFIIFRLKMVFVVAFLLEVMVLLLLAAAIDRRGNQKLGHGISLLSLSGNQRYVLTTHLFIRYYRTRDL